MLYHHLNAVAPTAVPKAVFIEWWRRYEHHARRNHALGLAAVRVVRALEGAGIPCVPYKGPLLAQALYGALALRAFDDIDILIRPRDLRRTAVVLEPLGYRPYYRVEAAIEAAMPASRLQYHAIFTHPSGHLLEVHWKTDPLCAVEEDTDEWWERLHSALLMGERVRGFSADAQLLMSAIHAMRHYGASMCWIVDVAEALRQPVPRDWKWIIARACSIGAWRRLATALCVANDVLDAPVPADVLASVRADAAVVTIAGRLAARLFEVPSNVSAMDRLRTDLDLQDGLRHRVRHLRSVVLDPTFHEWLAWPLPRALFPLYVPMRLARLAGKYATSWRDGRTGPGAPVDGGAARG